jgi:hypothetical protein
VVLQKAGLRFAKKTACLFALTLPLCFAGIEVRAETLGFVVTKWHIAGSYTKDAKAECPNGINPDNRDNFRAQFKTQAEQDEAIVKFANIEMHNRGPNGESVVYNPELTQDLLPHHEGQGKISNGFNLDGTADGRATETTCAHGKFTSPDGEPGIDNQIYRSFACVRGMRPEGLFDAFFNGEITTKQPNRWLVEISGVDDPANDDHVDVMVAHGLDKLVQDASGNFVPGLSQRVNTDAPDYIQRTTGRIVNHVLITDPMNELRLPTTAILENGERHFRNARLRLSLQADGAKGVLAGYHESDRFYRFLAKTLGQHSIAVGVSPASLYASLLRNADGFKNPATGQCTAISAAYDIELVRAFVVHEPSSTASVIESKDRKLAVAR